jgi:hypothetical protein
MHTQIKSSVDDQAIKEAEKAIYIHTKNKYIHKKYIHAYIKAFIYIHTYIHTYMHACMHACIHHYIHVQTRLNIPLIYSIIQMHTCIRHESIHTYIHTCYVCAMA